MCHASDNSRSTTDAPAAADAPPAMTAEMALEHAQRAFALKKYEQAVEHYATVLELQYVPPFPCHPSTHERSPLAPMQIQKTPTRRTGDGRFVFLVWKSPVGECNITSIGAGERTRAWSRGRRGETWDTAHFAHLLRLTHGCWP